VSNVAITVGETANNFTHTSNVNVNADGSAIVTSTDSNCSIIVRVSGNVLSYEERCSFGSGCVVTFFTQAGILQNNLSAPIGPERFVCSGLATSYSGNLIGSKAQARDLTLSKSGEFNDGDGSGAAEAGETISYTFRLTNGGRLPLTNVSVTDSLVSSVTCPNGNPIAVLAVGATETCTGTYTLTAADVTAGQVTNTVTATSDETGSVDASNTVDLP
jgi:uncharacterized repeat protein (TIGR01451 family)